MSQVIDGDLSTSATDNVRDLSREQLETIVQTEQPAAEDTAAAFFQMSYPRFKALLDTLSHNELYRVCLNLAGNEFVPEKNKPKNDKEKHAFYLGNELVQNRMIMRLAYEMQKAEEANNTNNSSNTEGEQTNG